MLTSRVDGRGVMELSRTTQIGMMNLIYHIRRVVETMHLIMLPLIIKMKDFGSITKTKILSMLSFASTNQYNQYNQ